jgi:hypothetical protein
MSRWEILHTRLGEMLEMLACYAIAHGAEPKRNRQLSYDEAMRVR